MSKAPRERTTIDLRGLGPALKAHARARNLTVSAVTRLALAAVLETSASGPQAHGRDEPDGAGGRPVKLTIRLRRGVAARLATRARACGLSHGAYLTKLIDEAPVPPLAVATALGASTEQLAVVSADLNELIRAIGRGSKTSSFLIEDRVKPLLDDVRQHIGVASRLMAELRPARTRSTRRPGTPTSQEARQ